MSGSTLRRLLPLAASLSVFAYAAAPNQRQHEQDPIATLIADLKAGKTQLKFEPEHGYLKDLLTRLDIPWSSQMLVFSKTSQQGYYISPRKPRAIYFNDQLYVGWVNGGDLIEIASVDAKEGTHMYTLRNARTPQAEFQMNPQECVACHGGRTARSVPSLIIRSVYPDPDGSPIFTSGGRFTTPSAPLKDRWGGWYVSGTHGEDRHMGNAIARGEDVNTALDMEAGANKTDLRRYFDSSEYLTPHSDIMALMVAEHQMEFQNRAGRAQMAVRNMGANPSPDRIDSLAGFLLDSLLGVDEIELTDPIKGTTTFARDFAKAGIKDDKGRSLYDLEFDKRMFKYRLSPMIYSPAFEGLPTALKEQIYQRLKAILTGQNPSKDYAHLTPETKQVLLEILKQTKPDF